MYPESHPLGEINEREEEEKGEEEGRKMIEIKKVRLLILWKPRRQNRKKTDRKQVTEV